MTRNIYFRLITALLLASALTACEDEDIVQNNGNHAASNAFWAQYDFVLGENSYMTRVSYEDDKVSLFEEGDEIGVYVVNDEGNLVSGETYNSNVRYVVRNATHLENNEQRQVLLPFNPNEAVTKNPAYHYVLYYPYDADMTLNRLKDYTHNVATDQGEAGAFEASDLLWCYYTPPAGSTEAYEVAFDHAMAQIVVLLGGIYMPGENQASAVQLLNMSVQATDINMVQPGGTSFSYTTSNTKVKEIGAWWFEKGSTDDLLQYRACIPAQAIGAGEPLVRIHFNSATYKDYKINTELQLKPGHTYTLTLSKEGITEIEINDDDTWVYDVLDPETGQPVGLLCREYLRYQEKDDTDAHTGTEGTNTDGTATKWINSQAWVFYNLQPGTDTPELSKGKVLRFLYDIDNRYSPNGGNGTTRWPAPHYKKSQLGLFTPMHGYLWADGNESYNWDYGKESEKPENYQEYYMHGGTIYWDGEHNKIIKFELPKENITNSQAAAQGHIAISQEGTVDISYDNIYAENAKIGFITPHYLIDTRTTSSGTTEINQYPLVKIGYNQFWMSKPLRTTIFTDGTPITCYNKTDGTMGISFNSDERIGAGYIFPFWTEQGNTTNSYDPYNNEDEMYPENTTFRPAPFYNKITIDHENFIPVPMNDQIEYLMPGQDDIKEIGNYFGPYFAAKMCTREIAKYNGDNFEYDKYTAVCKGETYSGSATANAYVANITGLNLHALGQLAPATNLNSCSEVTANATIMLKSSQAEYVDLFMIHVYDPWNATLDVGGGNSSTLQSSNHQGATYRITQEFAQVRLFMRFKNPTAGGTSVSYHTRSASPQQPESRNVYVPLEAVE